MPKAIIFGAAGQDGSYLAKLLLGKGYDVVGVEKAFIGDLWRFRKTGIDRAASFHLRECDITDSRACCDLLNSVKPDEIYNLAAQSSVALSFKDPLGTIESTAVGAAVLFEAVRQCCPAAHLFQASSSDMFGEQLGETLKREDSRFCPKSPYAVSKVFAHQLAKNYRDSYGLHFSSAILFNHESPLRTPAFVTMKIVMGAVSAIKNSGEMLELGNLDARRDWGYAPEYVDAMWRMVNNDKPNDYVIASGTLTSVRDFVNFSYEAAGIALRWEGSGIDEKAYCANTGRLLVAVNPDFFRPIETEPYGGDVAKARELLAWEPGTNVRELCRIMVQAALSGE